MVKLKRLVSLVDAGVVLLLGNCTMGMPDSSLICTMLNSEEGLRTQEEPDTRLPDPMDLAEIEASGGIRFTVRCRYE